VVTITAHGWQIVQNSPVRLRRFKGMEALPTPQRGGSLSILRDLINIGDDRNWLLLASWMAAACRPKGPYPVLGIQGEHGSAKSTLARRVRRIIDPSKALLRASPREERDLLIAANNSWIVAYDNLSCVPTWLSDALCRLATGGGYSARQLFTDADEVILDVQRPVIINGIDHLPERPDLAERSIILTLPPIDDAHRRDEASLDEEFERSAPLIFGALMDVISSALAKLPSVELSRKPRMADFALWATAAERGFGFSEGAFMNAYQGNRMDAVNETLDSDAVSLAIQTFMADRRGENWKGTTTELLAALTPKVPEGTAKSQAWPKTARLLSSRLRRLAPFLRDAGIGIDFPTGRGTAGRRELTIRRIDVHSTVTTVTTVPHVANKRLIGDHPSDGDLSDEVVDEPTATSTVTR
jgi:hypothetical protein